MVFFQSREGTSNPKFLKLNESSKISEGKSLRKVPKFQKGKVGGKFQSFRREKLEESSKVRTKLRSSKVGG